MIITNLLSDLDFRVNDDRRKFWSKIDGIILLLLKSILDQTKDCQQPRAFISRVSDPHFYFADPDPGKNFHADPDPVPDPGGIRGRGWG